MNEVGIRKPRLSVKGWASQGLALALLWSASCATPTTGSLQLVETTPVGTVLGSRDLPETVDVWGEMIEGARESIELCHFYLVSERGGLLDPIIDRLEWAAERGVRVRILVGEKFYGTYPELIDHFHSRSDIELRRLNLSEHTGGVQHAKYMVVDETSFYLGSANFDWRALEHIQELGVWIHSEPLTRDLLNLFEYDWALAAGEPLPELEHRWQGPVTCSMDRRQVRERFRNEVTVTPVYSPKGYLPDESQWDLPAMQAIIDGAERALFIQCLTFDLVDRDGTHFEALEDALIRAAARGVQIRIVVADWCDREGVIEDLQALTEIPEIGIRMATIPEHSGGHIPFARVVHAKYMVADRNIAWLGTSNWERGYFFESRNAGLILEGEGIGDRLDHYFRTTWSSPYVRDVLPEGETQ